MNASIRRNLTAYLFMLPWLVGLFTFIIGPMSSSLYFSFTKYDLVSSPKWLGLDNYRDILLRDDRFLKSLGITFQFVFMAVPLKLAFALLVAVVMNQALRFIGVYRAIYYIPSLVGGSVAVAIMWRQIFDTDGIVNQVLGLFGLEGRSWVFSPQYSLYTLILLAVWQFGSSMVIFLAGLKQIPAYLYESSSLDGANKWQQFWRITLPMLSPVLFFNLIMQLFYGFLMFTQAFIVTKGGPMDSTLVYAMYLYEKGFNFYQMGYASALSWIILVIIGIMTALLFASSKYWVHYETGGKS
ncbi:MAG: binding-protein-dependent transport system inner rane component [Paenibacillaceae bacterium]|nr:binding-protein-dependent transport system inner rane component [Paenibacillaceae bacterium]